MKKINKTLGCKGQRMELVNLSYSKIPPQNPASFEQDDRKHRTGSETKTDKPVLLHERAFSPVLQVDVIRIKVAFG